MAINIHRSVYQNFCDTNKKHSDRIAINYYSQKTTFSEVFESIDAYARAFRQLDDNLDDMVTICSPTIPAVMIAFYALNKIGVTVNFVSPDLVKSNPKKYLDGTNTKTLMILDRFHDGETAKAIAESSVETVIALSLADGVGKVPDYLSSREKYALAHSNFAKVKTTARAYNLLNGRKIKYLSLSDFIKLGDGFDDSPEAVYDPERTVAIVYTGGSTGIPKSVEKRNLEFNTAANAYLDPVMNLEMSNEHSNGLFIPCWHATGLVQGLTAPWAFGAQQIPVPIFNKDNFVHDIRHLKINRILHTWAAWQEFIFYVEQYGYQPGDFSHVEHAWGCGMPAPRMYRRRIDLATKKAGFQNGIRDGYGQTEVGSGPLAVIDGLPVAGVEIKICDDQGGVVADGTWGEIRLKTPASIKGYRKRPKTTKALYDDDGWLITGDMGMIRSDGKLEYGGRKKNNFVDSKGNVHYLFHMEKFLHEDERILKSHVIALDVDGGQSKVPLAQIVLDARWSDRPVQVIRHLHNLCRQKLPKEERPIGYRLMSEFPINADSSKPDYELLGAIRDGYYGVDKEGLYKISFPEVGKPLKRHLRANEKVKIY